jgi:hypothetical protein
MPYMDNRTNALINKLEEIIGRLGPIKKSWYSSNVVTGFRNTVEYEAAYTEAITLIAGIYGKSGPNYERIIHFYNDESLHSLEQTEGLLVGTKNSLLSGLLEDLTSRVLVDIKSDFLATAKVLLDEGQKDPAAVLACIVLEDSLKRLARKVQLTDVLDKELGVIASRLLNAGTIEKSTNQSIQNFKNLRNAALHAEWEHVSAESVSLLLAFLPMFLEKHGL